MRLSLRKGAWSESTPQTSAGNQGQWSTQQLREGKAHSRSLGFPPDFLSTLVVSVDVMRLSLSKAAYVAVAYAA